MSDCQEVICLSCTAIVYDRADRIVPRTLPGVAVASKRAMGEGKARVGDHGMAAYQQAHIRAQCFTSMHLVCSKSLEVSMATCYGHVRGDILNDAK